MGLLPRLNHIYNGRSLRDLLFATHDEMDGWMDGWMICDFTSFATVFKSYQDDGQMIVKSCVQWNPVYG